MNFKRNINESSNGKLGGGELKSIGGSHKLNPMAADAYLKMVEAAKNEGVSWSITDSYRSYEGQDRIFDWDHFNKTGKKRKKGTSGTPAAKPGTSNHGWGSAVDIGVKYGDKSWNWLTKNASKFGFSNPFKDPRTEPWHWEHLESARNMGANVSYTPSSTDSSTDATSSHVTTGGTSTETSSSTGTSLLKNILTQNLGLNKLTDSSIFGALTEEIERFKQLIK